MIKKYNEFINEGLGKIDAYMYILNTACKNMEVHNNDTEEYVKSNIEDGVLYVNVSGRTDEPLSACESDITFMILPSNFTPNVLVSLESGSNKKNTNLTKFQIVKDQKIVDTTKQFYDNVKNLFQNREFTTLMVTIGY